MTDPADLNQLCNAVSSQGATIGRHKELLPDLGGTPGPCLQHIADAILQLVCEAARQYRNPQIVNYPATSCVYPQFTPASQEPSLNPPGSYARDTGSCWVFLSQCSLIFELQPSSFPSDCLRIVYVIMLMSGRALAWATACGSNNPPFASDWGSW